MQTISQNELKSTPMFHISKSVHRTFTKKCLRKKKQFLHSQEPVMLQVKRKVTAFVAHFVFTVASTNVHISGTPTRDCLTGRPVASSANGRCSGSEMHGCKLPMPQCTPHWLLKPGWLGIQCSDPLCGSGRWHSCRRQYPKPTMPLHSIFSLQIVFCCLICLN